MKDFNSYYSVSVHKTTELETYQDGCDPDSFIDHGEVGKFRAATLEEIPKRIREVCRGIPYIFDDRLLICQQEDMECNPLVLADIIQWRKNNSKVYYATYSFYVTNIVENVFDHERLKIAFPQLMDQTE